MSSSRFFAVLDGWISRTVVTNALSLCDLWASDRREILGILGGYFSVITTGNSRSYLLRNALNER